MTNLYHINNNPNNFTIKYRRQKGINKIIYAEDLAMELSKYPKALVCAGKMGSNTYENDRKIENVFLRDGDTLVLNIENYDDNGELKYYR